MKKTPTDRAAAKSAAKTPTRPRRKAPDTPPGGLATDKYLVSQSNSLIEAAYSPALTARAHKVARLILALIKPMEDDLRLYKVKIEDLKQYLGYTEGTTWGRFYDDLKDISRRLNSEPIEIKMEKRALVAYFISSYVIDLQEGVVVYEISGQLKPYLVQLKGNFTSYLLSNIPRLNSKYSIRLYELLHQYRKIGRRVFEVVDLQKKLGSEYEKYSHFKARVLEASKADLETNTDLAFDYEEHKDNKRVVRIEFFIFPNKPADTGAAQPVPAFIEENVGRVARPIELSSEVLATLRELGITEKNVEKQVALGFKIVSDEAARKEAIRRCDDLDAYYLEKIALMRQSGTPRANSAGYLIKALQEDWQNPALQQERRAREQAQKQDETRKKLKQVEAQKEALSLHMKQRNGPIYQKLLADEAAFATAWERAMAATGDFLKKNFLADLGHLPPRAQYAQSTMLENMVNAKFREQHPHLFQPDYDNYVARMKAFDAEIIRLKS